MSRGRHNHCLRRLGEQLLDNLLLGGCIASWSYRCGLQGVLGVTQHEVLLAAERQLPRPLTIAFVSDLHAGPTTDARIFSSMFDQIRQHRPDLLLLGGDFVSGKAGYASALLGGLEQCKPPLGKFAVFGNHDLWTDERALESMLTGAGVRVLVNRNVALAPPFDSVSICGMDDPWTGYRDARSTFDGAGETRILLMHAPDGLQLLGKEKFDLGFAGHTHGGQLAMPNGKPIVMPHGPLGRKYCHGRYDLHEQGCLIVSRGIGCSTIPVRINADPEIVICRLTVEVRI